MSFDETLKIVREQLQSNGRMAYRALKRRFDLEDDYLEDIKAELIDAEQVARDEDGKVLVWVGTGHAKGKAQGSNSELETGRTAAPAAQLSPASTQSTVAGNRPQKERRQLTVLFCDMVGSTHLSEQLDPEDYSDVVQAFHANCSAIARKYSGHIAQHLGDGLLVYFGYPQAHEDDAQRSVRAGLDIINALRESPIREKSLPGPVRARIGIHTGVVVIGEMGSSETREMLALGDTPNIAARLQSIAPVDGIVVSAKLQRLAGGAFVYSDLGMQSLKGVVQPTRVYRVVEVSDVASRFEAATGRGLTPLVGREDEVSTLQDRWQLAKNGDGQVVLLSGDPGIGKSRIVSTLLDRLAVDQVTTLNFQCSPYHVNSAFYPIIDNFERALKFDQAEEAASKLDKLEALLVGQYAFTYEDLRFLATLLSIPNEDRYGVLQITPQKHKDETVRALISVIEAAAQTQPTVILFEDLHWADPTSLDVLDRLITRMRAIPALLVLTYRPEFIARWRVNNYVTALDINKLSRAQSTAIITRLTGGKALPTELLPLILARTDGVPLFVEELTKALLESGELIETDLRYEYASTARAVTIPASLRDSLTARLDRIQGIKEIAQVGATIGRSFDYKLLSAVVPKSESDLDRALERLTDSGLAYRHGTPPTATYTFKHALVQDAAYDSLLKSRRQLLHETIARVLEEDFPHFSDTKPEVLAHHLTAAAQDAEAIPYWQLAGKLALSRLALNESIAHVDKGMGILNTLPPSHERDRRELDLRTILGMAWVAFRGFAATEVSATLHPALILAKLLNRDDAFLPIYHGLWNNVLVQGRIAEALDLVNEMLETAKTTDNRDLLIVAHRSACVTHFCRGAFEQSREHGERVFALYDDLQHHHLADLMSTDPKTSVGTYMSIGSWILGYPDRAVQELETSDKHTRRRGHPFDIGFALTLGCFVWDYRREPAYALIRSEEAERLGRAHSLPFISDIFAQLGKSLALVRDRQLAVGIPKLRTAIETWTGAAGGMILPYYLAVLAEGVALSGDVAGGLELLDESLSQIARSGWQERANLAEVLRLKGWMLTLLGDIGGAEREYLASIDVAREQQAKAWELRTAMSLTRLWQQQDKRHEARTMLSEIYGWFSEGSDTEDLREAEALLVELND